MRLVCDKVGLPDIEGDLTTGTAIGASLVFIFVMFFVLFNLRVMPLGSAGALLFGAGLMVAIVLGPEEAYRTIGEEGNLRIMLLSLGIMVFVEYFQREELFSSFLKKVLREDISFLNYLCRVTFSTFLVSALFSIDAASVVFTPIVLQLWQTHKRPNAEMETLLLGISTSANLGGVLTIYASAPVAAIAARSAKQTSENRLDMVSSCVYLTLPAFVGFVLNTGMLIVYFKIQSKLGTYPSKDSVIELQDVEQSLITPNAIIDHIIQEEGETPGTPGITISDYFSDTCMQPPRRHQRLMPAAHKKGVEFQNKPRLPKFSVGDINAKGIQAQGAPSLYISHKAGEEDVEANKDQCHSLYNLDKIGYIAVAERHGKEETGMPRTISFYHSFSDLDSWQYTRDAVVNRFEPKKPPLSRLQRRRASSRGRLETVNFQQFSSRRLPRQRKTSVLYKGLVSDAVLLLPKHGVYRAFSGLSPSAQFLAGRRQEIENVVNIVNREFVQSKSKFFRVFIMVVAMVMMGLFFVQVPEVDFDIGMLPLGAVAIVMLTDAIWNRRNGTLLLRRLNWTVVLNYFALFILVKGLSASKAPLWIWSKMQFVSMSFNDATGVVVFVCLVLLCSHLFGGLTLTLIILDLPTCNTRLPQLLYLAWCTMIASNMTLHGSASNLLVFQKAMEIVQLDLSYWQYLRFSLVSSLIILVVGVGIIACLIYAVGQNGGLAIV